MTCKKETYYLINIGAAPFILRIMVLPFIILLWIVGGTMKIDIKGKYITKVTELTNTDDPQD